MQKQVALGAVDKARKITFSLLVLEGAFGGFYITTSRSITPIFLITYGFTLSDLLTLNTFAGLASLLMVYVLYHYFKPKGVKVKLAVALLIERIFWFLIPWFVNERTLITLAYAIAVASPLFPSTLINLISLAYFGEEEYRKLVSYRIVASSVASISAQILLVFTLFVGRGFWKFAMLYATAFLVGLVSVAIALLIRVGGISLNALTAMKIEEAEIKASTMYLLQVLLLASTNLLGIAWIPRLMIDFNTPDYFAALIGLIQMLSSAFASVFWLRRKIASYRYAITLLSLAPLMVYFVKEPYLHLGIAVLYSFSLVGTNLYVSAGFAHIVRRLGVVRASALLSSANALAMILGTTIGNAVSSYRALVFTTASIFGLIGLVIAFTAIPEFAITSPTHTKLYARILHALSITSYNYVMFSIIETAKTALKLIGLTITMIILFIIYRMLYYVTMLIGGGR